MTKQCKTKQQQQTNKKPTPNPSASDHKDFLGDPES
jgi:hypothetical protein